LKLRNGYRKAKGKVTARVKENWTAPTKLGTCVGTEENRPDSPKSGPLAELPKNAPRVWGGGVKRRRQRGRGEPIDRRGRSQKKGHFGTQKDGGRNR